MSININVKNNDNIKKINKIRVRNDTEIVDSTKGRINVNGVIKDLSLMDEVIITKELYAWGNNERGNLGTGTKSNFVGTPTIVLNTIEWFKLSTNGMTVLALDNNNKLYTWGNNGYGELGIGVKDWDDHLTPTIIRPDKIWSEICIKGNACLALDTDGKLWTWGRNYYGQIGDGTNDDKYEPTAIRPDKTWSKIGGGSRHFMAIDDAGRLWTWGYNAEGQIGDGTNDDKNVPTAIRPDKTWSKIDGGSGHSIAIDDFGLIWTWGRNYFGTLGNNDVGNNTNIPAAIMTQKTWLDISSGFDFCAAIDNTNKLYTWGRDEYGQLGNGTSNDDKYVPTAIITYKNWNMISAGYGHVLALDDNNKLYAWGKGDDRQLGNDYYADQHSPISIMSDKTWLSVYAGGSASFGLKNIDV